jgi:hypothetical protein
MFNPYLLLKSIIKLSFKIKDLLPQQQLISSLSHFLKDQSLCQKDQDSRP